MTEIPGGIPVEHHEQTPHTMGKKETPRRSPPGFHDNLKTAKDLSSFPRSEAVIFWGEARSLTIVYVCRSLKTKDLLPSNIVHKIGFSQKSQPPCVGMPPSTLRVVVELVPTPSVGTS